jgi:hypothetical protein
MEFKIGDKVKSDRWQFSGTVINVMDCPLGCSKTVIEVKEGDPACGIYGLYHAHDFVLITND